MANIHHTITLTANEAVDLKTGVEKAVKQSRKTGGAYSLFIHCPRGGTVELRIQAEAAEIEHKTGRKP
jgi:hypothetical protein